MNMLKTLYGLPALAMISLALAFIDTFIHPAGADGYRYMTKFGQIATCCFYIFMGLSVLAIIYSIFKEKKK